MKEIKLFNRDGADLKLVQMGNTNLWELKVDSKHEYVLEYIRIIGKENVTILTSNNWEAIDPSGGPFIALGSVFENYRVVGFVNCTTLIMEYEGNTNL